MATEGVGVPELVAAIESYLAHLDSAGLHEQKRIERWQERLVELIRQEALERVLKAGVGKAELEGYARQIARRERDPHSVVAELLRSAGISG